MTTKKSLSMRLLFAAAAFASVATAQDAASASGDTPWAFDVSLPVWAASISGDATVRGRTADVDVSFGDLKEHLDKAFALAYEARKGPLGFYGDFGYQEYSTSNSFGPGVGAEGELKFITANAGVSYVVLRTNEEKPLVVAATAGLRYWYTETNLLITPPGGPAVFNGSNSLDLYQGVVGFRASKYLTQKLHLDASGDIGGFNVAHDTDWTWSATCVASYDFTNAVGVSLGYRALAVNASEGSGVNEKGLDLVFHGVLAAVRFQF